MSINSVDITLKFKAVLSDLILATHCHSCGCKYAVTLQGYCSAHCSKRCWSTNELEVGDDAVCVHGGCKMCDPRYPVAKTRSMYHRREDYSKVIPVIGWNLFIKTS
jgi:hypothetical protein